MGGSVFYFPSNFFLLTSFRPISPPPATVLYALTFFFANFGPNSTTFILPAEVFATKFRSTLHGISASMGKLGAVVGAFGFGALQLKAGTRVTLVALAIVNFIGMLFTALVPETKRMHLDDAASKSTSTYGRRVQKDAACPLYEAENPGGTAAAAAAAAANGSAAAAAR